MDTLLTFCGLCFSFALASPKVALPINSQVPPIAQVQRPFSYEFASNTFQSSDGDALEYSLQTAPSWLQLDSDTRTLSGTPAASDVGPFTFQLSATDGHGVADSQVVFVVVEGTPPTFAGDISATLARNGLLSGPTSLLLMPETRFEITLGRDQFKSDGDLFFYATSADRSPLPSWAIFDAENVSLSGTTPTPAAAPRSYGMHIFASSIKGFAQVNVEFAIEVSNHELHFKNTVQTIQVAAGNSIIFDLGNNILLDGNAVEKEQISKVQVEGPSWIILDSESLTLIGQAPQQSTNEDVKINIWDRFNDTASMRLQISVGSGLSSLTTTTRTYQTSPPGPQNSSSRTETSKTQSTGQGAAPAAPDSVRDRNKRLSAGEIAAIVILPILVIVIIIGVCICLRRRRQRQFEETNEKALPGPGGGGSGGGGVAQSQRRRLGYHASWLPPITGLGSSSMHNGTSQSTALPQMQDGTEEAKNFSRLHTNAGAAQGSVHAHHPLQSHPDTGTSMSYASDTFRTDSMVPVSDMAVIEDGVVVWPRPRPGSVMARVLPGVGHGKAPTNRYSGSTCSYYGSTTEDIGTGRSSRASAAHQTVRRSTLKFQRLSTIRKVLSSSEASASSGPRSFSERRQSFINCRASYPNRPLFSAGPTETAKTSSDMTQTCDLASVHALQLQVKKKPDFNARYHGATSHAYDDNHAQTGSLESISSVWEDMDTNSMDSPDADHGSILIAEDASRSWLDAESQPASNVTLHPRREGVAGASDRAKGGNAAFL